MGRNYATANRVVSSENLATGAASDQSGAAPAQVYLARIAARSNPMFYAVGTNPTATAASTFLPQNEVEVIQVNPGEKIAAIQDGGAGQMNISWLTN